MFERTSYNLQDIPQHLLCNTEISKFPACGRDGPSSLHSFLVFLSDPHHVVERMTLTTAGWSGGPMQGHWWSCGTVVTGEIECALAGE